MLRLIDSNDLNSVIDRVHDFYNRVQTKTGCNLNWTVVRTMLYEERAFLWMEQNDPNGGCLIGRPMEDSASGNTYFHVIMAFNKTGSAMAEYLPQVELIASQINASFIEFQSTRKGFYKASRDLGFDPHAVIYRKEI